MNDDKCENNWFNDVDINIYENVKFKIMISSRQRKLWKIVQRRPKVFEKLKW